MYAEHQDLCFLFLVLFTKVCSLWIPGVKDFPEKLRTRLSKQFTNSQLLAFLGLSMAILLNTNPG